MSVDKGVAGSCFVLRGLMWPIKWLGLAFTIFTWPFVGLVALTAPLGWVDPAPSPLITAICAGVFVGWGAFFFGAFLPTYRWLGDMEISARLGQPRPRWRISTGGSIAHQIYEGANRQIAAVASTGVAVHPSEDGINDLGDTGGLPKGVVNPRGYQQISVGPYWERPRCANCHAILYGERRCRHCGVHLLSGGQVDWEAQRDFEAAASRGRSSASRINGSSSSTSSSLSGTGSSSSSSTHR